MTTVTISDSARALAILEPELRKAEAQIMNEMSLLLEQQEALRNAIILRDNLQGTISRIAQLIAEEAA